MDELEKAKLAYLEKRLDLLEAFIISQSELIAKLVEATQDERMANLEKILSRQTKLLEELNKWK